MHDQEQQQARLTKSLIQNGATGHPAEHIQFTETHISRLIITPDIVLKLKKPVNFGFLDFSTLEKRKTCCEAEVRFNSRLSPQLYLGVVAIDANGRLDSGAAPVEYAVKMQRFDENGMLDRMLDAGLISASDIICLADDIGRFHADAPVVPDSRFGAPRSVSHWFDENFEQIGPLLQDDDLIEQLQTLQAWGSKQELALAPLMEARQADGFIRECHGDLHPGNIVLHDEAFLLFDCIEFNDELRCIDVISDAAFLMMDLLHRGRTDLAYAFLDRYLQVTGDYAALPLLRFYIAYRALVRAKVALLTLQQTEDDAKPALLQNYTRYAALAENVSRFETPRLIITRGLSGSGKTTYARAVSRLSAMICLRSDTERKRLAGLEETADSRSGVGDGIYTAEFNDLTYQRLAELAGLCLASGFSVVVDATFLEKYRRDVFAELARNHGADFYILNLFAPLAELESRIEKRRRQGSDASEADVSVLRAQNDKSEPLLGDEMARLIDVDTVQVAAGGRDFAALLRRYIGSVS